MVGAYMKWGLAAALGLTALNLPAVVKAEVVISCDSPSGQRYAQGHGWFSDAFTGGLFQLVRDGDKFDIFVTDVAGTRSARADGANVIATEIANSSITLVAAYPRALETYLFDFENNEMIFTSMKISVGPRTAAVFFATCQ
jgi:hypothetical protein